MNAGYRIIWSESVGAWVVVSEHAKSKGKSARSSRARRQLAAIGGALLFSAGAAQAFDIVDSQIVTTADDRPGIAAHAAGDVIDMYDSSDTNSGRSSITTSGRNSHAVSVANGAQVTLTNTDLTATGTSAKGITVAGAGSSVVMRGGTVVSWGDAVAALNGGSAEISDSVLSSINGHAAYASGEGASVILNNVAIIQNDGLVPAIRSDNGASVSMSGGSILTNGRDGTGLSVVGTTGAATTVARLDGTSIETTGASAHGIQGSNGNTSVSLDRVSIVTRGSNSHGIYMSGKGAGTTAVDTTIHTFGSNANGAVNFGGAMDLNGVTIITEGDGAHGLYVSDNSGAGISHATTNANNVSVTTNGVAYGVMVREGAEMVLSNSSITSHGKGIAAAQVNGLGIDTTRLTLNNVQLSATGQDSHGLRVANNATAILSNAVVQSTLGGGLASVAGSAGIRNTIKADRTSITALNGNGIAVTGGAADIDLAYSSVDAATVIHVADNVINNADGSTTTIAADTVTMNVSNSYLNGATGAIVESGSLHLNLNNSTLNGDIRVAAADAKTSAIARVNLASGSLFRGAALGVDQLDIDGSSLWQLTGDSTVNSTVNAGTIAFVTDGGFKTLTANNYAGNNGKLVMNTHLGDDSSASDKLIIDGGHADGTTTLIVNNAGGAGGLTDNGILLVEAINGGTTDATAFNLGQGVRAGAYDYRLFRSGQYAGQEDNWYLRSWFDDTGEHEEIHPLPIYGPELSVYGAIMPTASRLGLATLGTLHERVGEQENLRANGPTDGKTVNGAWGRILGQSYRDQYSSIVDPTTSVRITGFQVGADLYRNQHADGRRDHIGTYFAAANADVYVSGRVTNAATTGYERQRTGTIDLNAANGGLYWTHFGKTGWYSDLVMQATSYSGTANTDRTAVGINGSGLLVSLEGGYPLQLNHGLVLEPQAQMIYQRIALRDTSDQYSTIGLGSSHSVTARAGARLQYTSKQGDRVIQPYLRANLWSTLAGATNTVDYGGIDAIKTQARGSWAQFGFGVTAKIDKNVSFFGNLDGMFNVSGKEAHSGAQVSAGMRVNW